MYLPVLPEATAPGPPTMPVAVATFMHGGLWWSGSRAAGHDVCWYLAANHGIPCASVDYQYSDALGGCCGGAECPSTYGVQGKQAAAAAVAVEAYARSHYSSGGGGGGGGSPDGSNGKGNATTSDMDSYNRLPVLVSGHSAGGHLAVLLALKWADLAPPGAKTTPPHAFIGIQGIYDAAMWDAYDADMWGGGFACATKQAFGGGGAGSAEWQAGSPTVLAATLAPAGPLLLVHSPGDTWVQMRQAEALYAALKQPAFGEGGGAGADADAAQGQEHQIDTAGKCGAGQHPSVIQSASAADLAACMAAMAPPAAPVQPTQSSSAPTPTPTSTTTSTSTPDRLCPSTPRRHGRRVGLTADRD